MPNQDYFDMLTTLSDSIDRKVKNGTYQQPEHQEETGRLPENTRVLTPHGLGTIIGVDLPLSKNWRYMVSLDKNPFSFDRVCYYKNEIKIEHHV